MDSESWTSTQRVLALLLPIAFIVIIILLIFHPLQSDNPTTSMVNTLVGILGTMATGVATYYFGSSKGSTDKDNSRDKTLTTLVDKVVANGKDK